MRSFAISANAIATESTALAGIGLSSRQLRSLAWAFFDYLGIWMDYGGHITQYRSAKCKKLSNKVRSRRDTMKKHIHVRIFISKDA